MKYILLISFICSGIINDVFAQKKLLVNRHGETVNNNVSHSSKETDVSLINNSYKPGNKPKPKPLINADATLFYESFDNVPAYMDHGNGTYNFPDSWLRFNVDGLTPYENVDFVNEAWVRAPDVLFSETDSVAFSTSWYNPAGRADDWMWTPVIGNLSIGTNLKWVAKTYYADYPDGYEVWIMRASESSPTGGVGDLGNMITHATKVFSVAAEETEWTEHTVNLNAFVGDGIYIGFRNHSTDKFLLMIDDILVESFTFDDLATMQPKRVSEYNIIPLSETRPLNFETQIFNSGSGPANQVKLHVDIKKETEPLASIASSEDVIAPNSTQTFTIPTAFTPKSLGKHHFKFYHSALNPDPYPNNNIAYADSVYISRNTFSRATGKNIAAAGLGVGDGMNALIGTTFTLNTTEKVRGILVGIRPDAGIRVRARIYTTTNGVPNDALNPLWESNEVTFNGTEPQYTFFTGDTIPTLAPGTYWFGCLESDMTLKIWQYAEIFTPNTNFLSWKNNPYGLYAWTAAENFGPNFARALNINPVFDCPDDVVINANISQEYNDTLANKTIVTDKAISNSKVLFEATKSITLHPGFSTEGNRFSAQITANVCPNIDF